MHAPRSLRRSTLVATTVALMGLAAVPTTIGAQTLAPGSALVRVTGDIETTLVLPLVPETAAATADGFDLRFQDEGLDTLNVTLAVDSGRVTDTFVGVGVPGTSIFDAAYFADYLHTQCVTDVVAIDASGVYATIDCAGLENGAGDATVDLHVELTTIGLAIPSTSPGLGSPMPSSGPSTSPAV